MPGSGSDIVTVGNRAALLQYQTSAEDGVCPPGLPSAVCLSYLGRRRGGGSRRRRRMERQTTCR